MWHYLSGHNQNVKVISKLFSGVHFRRFWIVPKCTKYAPNFQSHNSSKSLPNYSCFYYSILQSQSQSICISITIESDKVNVTFAKFSIFIDTQARKIATQWVCERRQNFFLSLYFFPEKSAASNSTKASSSARIMDEFCSESSDYYVL